MPLILGAAAALVALVCAAGYRRAIAPALAPGTTPEQATRTVAAFLKGRRPELVRELPSLEGARGELVDPRRTLPFTHELPLFEMRALYEYTRTCATPPVVEDVAVQKALLWARVVCGDAGAVLPPDFLARPPLMHPSGHSYAFLANGPQDLRHLLEEGGIGRAALAAMVAGDAQLLTEKHAIFLYSPEAGASRYLFFPRKQWDAFEANQPVKLIGRTATARCLPGASHFCWTPAAGLAEERADGLGAAALAALCVTVLSLALAAAARVATQRRERAARARIVRTLTHELRTPATSLAFSLETLRDEFDSLPAASQSAFLRMASDVERLKRVIAASAGYLRVERAGAPGPGVGSVNGFLAAHLERYGDAVRFEPLPCDGAVRVDPHWLEVGVTNLVDNALRHGKPPVVVRVSLLGRRKLAVAVVDGGVLTKVDVPALAAAAQSAGLGLGLTLVDDVARAFGGALRIARSPASFTLELPIA